MPLEVNPDSIEVSTEPKRRPFQWSKAKIKIAGLIAESERTEKEICAEFDISRQTLYTWKQIPEFSDRIRTLRQAWEMRVMSQGIANKANRVAFLDRMHADQRKVIEARREAFKKAVGGDSGYVTINEKIVGWSDGEANTIEEQEFDSGFSREVRATLAQAADEVGQSVSKHEITGADGGPIQLSINVFDDIAARVRAAKIKSVEARK